MGDIEAVSLGRRVTIPGIVFPVPSFIGRNSFGLPLAAFAFFVVDGSPLAFIIQVLVYPYGFAPFFHGVLFCLAVVFVNVVQAFAQDFHGSHFRLIIGIFEICFNNVVYSFGFPLRFGFINYIGNLLVSLYYFTDVIQGLSAFVHGGIVADLFCGLFSYSLEVEAAFYFQRGSFADSFRDFFLCGDSGFDAYKLLNFGISVIVESSLFLFP